MGGRATFALGVVLLALAACSAPRPEAVDPGNFSGPLPGLTDGGTTREEALLAYGMPTGRFEDDRILTWMLRSTEGGRLVPVSGDVSWRDPRFRAWELAQFDLVLVFGPDGRLVRHRLIQVN